MYSHGFFVKQNKSGADRATMRKQGKKMPAAIDIKGQAFGSLTTRRLVSAPRARALRLRGAHWLCRCECGRYKIARGCALRSKHIRSCGCRFLVEGIDVTGERYGALVAIKRSDIKGAQGASWLFQCDCGSSPTIRLKDVRYGNTLSCGCLKSPKGRKLGAQSLAIERPWRQEAS